MQLHRPKEVFRALYSAAAPAIKVCRAFYSAAVPLTELCRALYSVAVLADRSLLSVI